MSEAAQKSPGLKPKLRLAGKRLRAWWEGAEFDADAARAAIEEQAAAEAREAEAAAEEKPEKPKKARKEKPPKPPKEKKAKEKKPAKEAKAAPEKPRPRQVIPDHYLTAQRIWGEGWVEPGSGEWVTGLARRLQVEASAHVLVLGAGFGGPPAELAAAYDWLADGYSDIEQPRRGRAPKSYDALIPTETDWADAVISLFDLHRAPDFEARIQTIAQALKPGARAAIVDFVASHPDTLLETCFPAPWSGSPQRALHYEWTCSKAGLRIVKMSDETETYQRLIAAGWEKWKEVYDEIVQGEDDAARRADRLNALSDHAKLWASRHEAMCSGDLFTFQFLVEKTLV